MTERLPELLDAKALQVELGVSALVYVLDTDHGTKVGMSIQTVTQRVDDLKRASGLRDIRVVRVWPFRSRSDARLIEKGAHWLLRDSRTVGEWFHCHPLEACTAVEFCLRRGVPLEAEFGPIAAAQMRRWRAEQAA